MVLDSRSSVALSDKTLAKKVDVEKISKRRAYRSRLGLKAEANDGARKSPNAPRARRTRLPDLPPRLPEAATNARRSNSIPEQAAQTSRALNYEANPR